MPDIVVWFIVFVVAGELAFIVDKGNTFELDEFIDDCESGLTNFAGFCVRFGGIGGGNGIFIGDDNFSVSFANVKWIDELDDEDDDGEGKFIFEFIGIVDGSSSIEFDATTRSRSFRTSRTVRWNNCWTYS